MKVSSSPTMCRLNSLLTLAVLWACCAVAKEVQELEVLSHPNRCSYEYAYDMYGAHCAGLRLTKIPSLKAGIEILDFNDNRLREIHSDTLSSYTFIKFLYLADNQIYSIHEDAFIALNYLETLDLSRNVIMEISSSVFQLPSLRKLYLNGNPLLQMSSSYIKNKPIKAPIELLDVSDCKIRELPDLGVAPQLVFYNISHNPLLTLDVHQFAQMCHLEKLDLTEAIDRVKLCELHSVILWLQEKKIYFQLEDYSRLNTKEFGRCPVAGPELAELNATHQRCTKEYSQIPYVAKGSRRTWLTIGGGLAGFLVGFILLLYLVHRHNVAKTKSRAAKNSAPAHDGDKQATAVLLDDAS